MNKEQIRTYLNALDFTEGLGDEYPAYDFVDIDFEEHVRIELSGGYPYEYIGVGPNFKDRLQEFLTGVEELVPILARIREAERELDPIATLDNVKEFLDKVGIKNRLETWGHLFLRDLNMTCKVGSGKRLSWYKAWAKRVLTNQIKDIEQHGATVRCPAEEELRGLRDILDKLTAEGV